MSNYKNRFLAPLLKKIAVEAPVTVLSGARQVGKSTLLLKELASGWRYYSVDDFEIAEQINTNPLNLLQSSDHIILDEAQKSPGLLPIIKNLVDRNPGKRFILSGSANLLLMSQTTESLAGRAQFLDLEPMSEAELKGESFPSLVNDLFEGKLPEKNASDSGNDLPDNVWRGGFPVVLSITGTDALVRWRESYIQSYLERDLRQLSQVDNLLDFRRLMRLTALRTGCVLNQSELARDAGLSQPTTHRYLNLLETSKLLFRIPAYRANATSRLVKSPKVMWLDSGLASHLCGIMHPESMIKHRSWGFLLECYAYAQIKAITAIMPVKPGIFYWRTRKGEEVDLIIELNDKILAIEIKSSSNVHFGDTQAIQQFMEKFPDTSMGIVFYSGDQILQFGEKIYGLPLSCLWS